MSDKVADASPAIALAHKVAGRFAQVRAVEAVVLSGSRSANSVDLGSDIDLYVYSREPVALEVRRQIASPARRAEVGNAFWEPGDEWIDAETGFSVDVMFRDVRWIEDRLEAVLARHEASIGYSTCFWYNVRNSRVLLDPTGWFAGLQDRAAQPYPAGLKRAVIAKNFPILRRNLSSYTHQIELAIARKDLFSIHHRTTALLASYFDILFAVNEQPHPGEKRLVERVAVLCGKRPDNFPRAVEELLTDLASRDRRILDRATVLLDGLESLLMREGLSDSGEVLLGSSPAASPVPTTNT